MGGQALLFIIFTVAYTKRESWHKVCPTVLSEVGIDLYFGDTIAHTIHSLTLEDIRYYFKKDATVDNGIPTVNLDLTPNVTRVLSHAPPSGYDLSFKTIALRHTDQVLSKMSTKDWGITGYSVLERLVHAQHMAELWERSRRHYENFVWSPPSRKVCRCMRRIDENGVRAELELLALRVKFPGLVSGDPELPFGKNADPSTAHKKYSQNIIRLGELRRTEEIAQETYYRKLLNFDFHGDEEDVIARVREELQNDKAEGKIDPLVDEESWEVWKESMIIHEEHIDSQFGMFMYCMLNK